MKPSVTIDIRMKCHFYADGYVRWTVMEPDTRKSCRKDFVRNLKWRGDCLGVDRWDRWSDSRLRQISWFHGDSPICISSIAAAIDSAVSKMKTSRQEK